jgi:hypothetical protein
LRRFGPVDEAERSRQNAIGMTTSRRQSEQKGESKTMEHTVDAASWRRWTQFSLRGLMLLVLMVALFFSGRATGRATLQQEVNASRATFARQRELHARMMDFRNRLKPLKLPPNVKNMDRKAKPGEIDAWAIAGNDWDNGYCYNSFYASSAESVNEFWLGEVTELMI